MNKTIRALITTAVVAATITSAATSATERKTNAYYPGNKAPLAESAFSALPLGAVKPQGWLKEQLKIQASSLTGHLPEFWKDLGPDSGWLGGDGESWERGPYYLDGMVPLAFLTGDKKLLDWAHKWVGWTLDHQAENGWFGPAKNQDWWPVGLMTKTLTQYQEATNDPRVIPLLTKFFAHAKTELPKRPLKEWAAFRWADTALTAIWLYNKTGDQNALEVGKLLMSQGYDYSKAWTNFEPWANFTRGWTFESHGVNAGMGLKTPAVQYMLTGDEKYRKAMYTGIETLDKHHGQATGMYSADECFGGKNPSRGTELCAVDEAMFSYENMIRFVGDPKLADRLEKITYNAWPATFSGNMWVHQYDQQVNQIACKVSNPNWWGSNGAHANLFGVEPQFGCCTSNMHQGWPKFVSHLWMATPDDGLAVVAYGPSTVTAMVRGGSEVTIEETTNYPFDENIVFTIKTAKPVKFPLQLRIPAWAEGAKVKAEGKQIDAKPESFATIDRTWKNGDKVFVKFPMSIRTERRFNNSATVLRGPLVYSLRIGENWHAIGGEAPHNDFEVLPTTPWNYGLLLDDPKSIKVIKKKVGNPIFSSENAPIELKIKGRIVPEWKEERNGAGLLPVSPVKSNEPVQELTLIPYGCAKLRVTEFPVLEK